MSKHSKSRSKSSSKNNSKVKWADVICPKCGAWKGKKCKYTKGSNKGEYRSEPHTERVAIAKNPSAVKKVAAQDPKVEKKAKEEKNPLKKCTPEQLQIINLIIDKAQALSSPIEFVGPVTIGPYVTTYRFKPLRRTKVKKVEQLGGDFAVALGRESVLVRMLPNDSAIGIFVANEKKQKIELRDTLEGISEYMQQETEDGHLPIPLNFGMDVAGKPYIDDLTTLPHLLVAGTTGSGKSTEIRAAILSMAHALPPKQLQMVISDTKVVEFKAFQELPHLIKPTAGLYGGGYCNSSYSTMAAMEYLINQTQHRYNLLAESNVQNIHQYNAKMPESHKLPYIVLIIDELADLLGLEQSRAESRINADKLKVITARSRAAGIYVIAATQRPDVKTVVGAIKANFPARLSLRLPSHRDSQTILGTTGAQNLMSRGDMLYISATNPLVRRLHAPWTSSEDVKDLLESINAREASTKGEGDHKDRPSSFRGSIQ